MQNPQPTAKPVLGPQHGWVWAALPPGPGSVMVRGDPGLAAALADAGWSVVPEARPLRAAEAIRDAAALEDGAVLTLAADGSGSRRALAETIRIGRRLEAAGLDVDWIATGDRSRRHRLRVADGVCAARPYRRVILVASRGVRPPTALTTARAAAEAAAGTRLAPRGVRVLAGGMLLVELDAPGGRRLLRVASGAAGELLERSESIRAALAAAAPAAVRDRLVAPIARGESGAVRWMLEPKLPGGRPRHLSATLRADCLELLVALRATPAVRGFEAPADEAAALAPWLAGRERAVLERVSARLGERLADVARGWCHGDFWSGNLLVRRGRLGHVLDWDAAVADGLPLIDLLHLMAYGDRSLRRLPHGLRCTRALWPLAAAGGTPEIRRYCETTATPSRSGTLEALAIAYWLGRVARDLRTFSDRPHRPQWMADNVHQPLAELEARGW